MSCEARDNKTLTLFTSFVFCCVCLPAPKRTVCRKRSCIIVSLFFRQTGEYISQDRFYSSASPAFVRSFPERLPGVFWPSLFCWSPLALVLAVFPHREYRLSDHPSAASMHVYVMLSRAMSGTEKHCPPTLTWVEK